MTTPIQTLQKCLRRQGSFVHICRFPLYISKDDMTRTLAYAPFMTKKPNNSRAYQVPAEQQAHCVPVSPGIMRRRAAAGHPNCLAICITVSACALHIALGRDACRGGGPPPDPPPYPPGDQWLMANGTRTEQPTSSRACTRIPHGHQKMRTETYNAMCV